MYKELFSVTQTQDHTYEFKPGIKSGPFTYVYYLSMSRNPSGSIKVAVGGTGEDCGSISLNPKEVADVIDALVKIQNGEL